MNRVARKLGEDIIVIRHDGGISNFTEFSGIVRGVNENFDGHLQRLRVYVDPLAFPNDSTLRQRIWKEIHAFFVKRLQ